MIAPINFDPDTTATPSPRTPFCVLASAWVPMTAADVAGVLGWTPRRALMALYCLERHGQAVRVGRAGEGTRAPVLWVGK